MRHRYALGLFLLLVIAAGCAGGGGGRSVTPPTATSLAPSASSFKIPASLSLPVPPKPPSFTPASPSKDRHASTVTPGAHPAFFGGEASLGSGAYYLAFPNGNIFGYYSYLADPSYIYHFDMGYEYVYDANDGQGGIYFYDFTTQHWWYTGRNYPFPYVYDFSLNALLYYYADTGNAGHYTAAPRYFYNFASKQIITIPDATPAPTPSPKPAIGFLENPVYISGVRSACATPPPANSVCHNDGYASSYFNEVGGFQPAYTFGSSDASITAVVGSAQDPHAYYAMGMFSLEGYKPGVSTITVSSPQHQASLTVYVTTLQIAVTLNNLPTAYSMTLTPGYDSSDGCGFAPVTPQTIRLPNPMPAAYVFTFANYSTNMTVPCGLPLSHYQNRLLSSLSLTVSDGLNTIASKSTPLTVALGTANTTTLTVP